MDEYEKKKIKKGPFSARSGAYVKFIANFYECKPDRPKLQRRDTNANLFRNLYIFFLL
jgi:hypothetical protein